MTISSFLKETAVQFSAVALNCILTPFVSLFATHYYSV